MFLRIKTYGQKILRNIYLKADSEKKLRHKSDKMFKKLIKVGFYESAGN